MLHLVRKNEMKKYEQIYRSKNELIWKSEKKRTVQIFCEENE